MVRPINCRSAKSPLTSSVSGHLRNQRKKLGVAAAGFYDFPHFILAVLAGEKSPWMLKVVERPRQAF